MTEAELHQQLSEVHAASFGWALNCVGGDQALAEDVLHDTYIKVLTGKAHFAGCSSFKTWLFAVIRRTAGECSRRQKLRQWLLLQPKNSVQFPAVCDPALTTEAEQLALSLRQALQCLPARQSQIMHLLLYQELAISEAAQVMDISVGSARTHYERGKKRLRELLEVNRDG